MNTERIEYIDLAKGVAIFLMVLCHVGMYNEFTQWIYAFHMPLFFIVSGMLYKTPSLPMKETIKKKVKQLLIPYFLFAMILCFGKNTYFDWINILYGSRNSLFASSTFTPLWFLPCFFVSYIVFILVNKIERSILRIIITFIVGSLGFLLSGIDVVSWRWPFNLDVALVGVMLMGFGNLLKNKVLGYKSGGVFLLIGSILAFLNLPNSLTQGNPHVEMSIGIYGNYFMFFINAILLTLGVLSMLKSFSESKYSIVIRKPFLWLGKNTLLIMCVHGTLIVPMLSISKFKIFEYVPHNLVIICITLIALTLCYPISKFVSSYVPNLIGKNQIG